MDEIMTHAFDTMDDKDPVSIWSNEHKAWWRPMRSGYVPQPAHAGQYNRDEAKAIRRDAYIGWTPANPCPEVIVPTRTPPDPYDMANLAAEITEAATAAWEARDDLAVRQVAYVYTERAELVAYLAAIHPSVITPAPDAPGYWLVFITLPEGHGQVSWHIHPNDLYLFDHVTRYETWKWDGHTTKDKRERLRRATETAHTWVAGPVGE